jgi:hypothetical protein
MRNVFVDDICCKKRSESNPVRFCGIEETVKCVFRKILLEGSATQLHIHASANKNIAEFVSKQRNRRDTLFLGPVAFFQQRTDFMF